MPKYISIRPVHKSLKESRIIWCFFSLKLETQVDIGIGKK